MVSFQVSAAGSGRALGFSVPEAGVLVAGSRIPDALSPAGQLRFNFPAPLLRG